MKNLLTTLLVLMYSLASQAQSWTAPSENEYPTSTPVYIQVNINGQPSTSVEIAAFINGECRGTATEATTYTDNGNLYPLRVWGDNTDINKQITFKVFDRNSGLIFACTKQTLFTGETVSEVPFVLNIDKPTGVNITNPIKITTKFPNKIDLSKNIEFTYSGRDLSGELINYEPIGESSIESPLIYEWTTPTGGSFTAFTIDNNNILTATQSTLLPGSIDNTGEEALLSINVADNGTLCSGTTTIIIEEDITPVTGISCSIQTVKINKGESLYDLADLRNAITIEPADASNKNYYFEPANAEEADAFNNGVALKGGIYKVKIVSEYDSQIYTEIEVDVYAPVISIRMSQETIHAKLNDNIYDLVSPYVNIYPEDASDKTFSIDATAAGEAIVNGIAMKPGKYTIDVVSNDNNEIRTTVTIVITAIYAPEKIDVEINTSVYDILRPQIEVIPENEEGESYTITPADTETANAIVDGFATKNGEYTLIITSVLNKNVSVEVKVYVTTPVNITFPESLTISKFKDTEFSLTMTGDNFDPDLVELEFTRTVEPTAFGIPTSTTQDGLLWNIRATGSGSAELRVKYNGEYMPREGAAICYVDIPVEISFNNNGWDWIYAPANIALTKNDGKYIDQLNVNANNKIIEMRSQTSLLYNDPTLGIFGSITALTPNDGMYKIKANYADASYCVLTSTQSHWNRDLNKAIKPGYTWIGYTNEWDMTLDELNTLNGMNNIPNEGDQIIGKNGFAEYNEGAWVSTDFILEAGKGYLYYNNSDADLAISFDYTPDFNNISMQAFGLKKRNASVWVYDASQFADNMAIVAAIPNVKNPDNYTIGAFVNEECRGMGRIVKGNTMMINVAGKAGENVSFRLYDETTGKFYEINESVSYSQKAGSMKAPVILSVNGSGNDGISAITDINSDKNSKEELYDLNGQRVDSNAAAGVYIVKSIVGGNVTVKKVIKK